MKFDVLTLFPEMFEPVKQSILGRAEENKLIEVNLINIRDFSENKHKKVDDTPYGGGAGMVMQADVIYNAYKSIKKTNAKVIYMSPQGQVLNQKKVEGLSKEEHLIILCGHYEGVDQRILDKIVDEEISIGNYVLTGGELPAMVLIDSVSRYVDGVLSDGSTSEESFSQGILEYPQYTRPETFEGVKVPEILQSGHHENINKWRRYQALKNTYYKRPELLENVELSEKDKEYLDEIKSKKDIIIMYKVQNNSSAPLVRRKKEVNTMDIIKSIEHEQLKNTIPDLKVGNTVRVHVKIKEGNKERIQVFEGIIIKKQGGGVNATFTVRKISYGVGVEKTFLIHSPLVEKVEVVRVGKARRAKLYYLRERTGKASKTKEMVGARIENKEIVVKENLAEEPVVEATETVAETAEKAE